MKNSKWKMVIQILISLLTAIATTLGTTSCLGLDDPLPTSPRGGELTLPLGEMEGVTNEVEGDGALGFVCDLCHSLKTFR